MRRSGLTLGGVHAIWAVCAVTLSTNPIPAYGQTSGVSGPDVYAENPRADLTVHEGIGVGDLQIGDPAEKIEQILGEADAGGEHYRRYNQIGLYIQLYKGKVYGLTFDERFPGKLLTSELGIGNTLSDLERAYGPILERREVADHNAWRLDRILLVRRGGPQLKGVEAAKVHYYDLGMRFYFDEDDHIIRFGLTKHTGYALRAPKDRNPSNAPRKGLPTAEQKDRVDHGWASDRPALSVHEGFGFADARLGDPAKLVEELLGPPNSGSERVWRFRDLGITVVLNAGRVSAFFFHKGGTSNSSYRSSFAGKLVASGIGIGDSLDDVEVFYGAVLGRKRVRSLNESAPTRVLRVCDGCPENVPGSTSRIRYDDLGLYFDFDKQDRIVGFGMNKAHKGSQ